MAKNTNIPDVPGCIYLNKNRYWWRVKLPGQDNYTAMPLKPVGSKLATTDLNTAKEIARNRWEQAIYSVHNKQIESCDTIGSLAAAYFQYIEIYYRRADGETTGESERIRWGIKTFLEMYAALSCEEFGPLKLEKVRDQLIKSGTSRKVINAQIGMIKRMFKWGASKQLVPVYIFQGLQTLEGLRQGRSEAKERPPVKPVPELYVRAVLPFTAPTIAVMIQVQLLTGMRSGELVIMRPCDIEIKGDIWQYRPHQHKTAHHGIKRVVSLGPQVQQLIRPYLKRRIDAYCFSPAEVMVERLKLRHTQRKTPLSCGNLPGSNCKDNPEHTPGEKYNTQNYYQAVQYAIKAYNEELKSCGIIKDDSEAIKWTPHQLRHNAATKIRKEISLDAARALLGHRHLTMTDGYAELDETLATDAALRFG